MKIDNKRLIFVHIPRTGGTTVEYICGVHQRVHGSKVTSEKHWWGQNAQHFTAEQMVTKLKGIHQFKTYTSFAVVRNPYDRLISVWKRHSKLQNRNITFENFVNKHLVLKENVKNERSGELQTHLKHQYKYISMDGKVIVNKIFKLENFDDVVSFLKQHGFDKNSIKLTTTGETLLYDTSGTVKSFNGIQREKENYMDYYNTSTLDKVNKYYAKDFEILGYEMVR